MLRFGFSKWVIEKNLENYTKTTNYNFYMWLNFIRLLDKLWIIRRVYSVTNVLFLVTYSRASLWKCNLCKGNPVMSEDLIKSHCSSCHRVSQQYKCCLCNFADDEKNEVNKHMHEKHESVSQVVVAIYKEVIE